MKSPPLRLQPADYVALDRFMADRVQRRGRWFHVVRAGQSMAALLLIFGFIALFSYSSRFDDAASNAVHVGTLLMLMAVALLLASSSLARHSVKGVTLAPDSPLLWPFEMTLDAQGVQTTAEGGASCLSWSSIEAIVVMPERAFLVLPPNRAFIVPAAAFADRAAFLTFVDAAQAYKDAAVSPRP